MTVLKFMGLVYISFTFLIPFPSTFAQPEIGNVTVKDDEGFASLRDTWNAVQKKFGSIFSSNKGNCSKEDQKNLELSVPQQRTFLATIMLPCLGVVLLILICWICSHRFCCKPDADVPPFLAFHFPLYQNAAESRTGSPIFDREYSSLSYTFPNLQTTSISQRCP